MNQTHPQSWPALDAVAVCTVGHSDRSSVDFTALLHRHGITTVVDVRSQPYSQWAPQFNRETLIRELQSAGLHYVFLGDVLGGRPAERSFYDPGQTHPNYERLAQSPAFQSGIDRVLALAAKERIAIMCSEGDPLRCHRSVLLTPALLKRGARVWHILPDGTLTEAHSQLEQRRLL